MFWIPRVPKIERLPEIDLRNATPERRETYIQEEVERRFRRETESIEREIQERLVQRLVAHDVARDEEKRANSYWQDVLANRRRLGLIS